MWSLSRLFSNDISFFKFWFVFVVIEIITSNHLFIKTSILIGYDIDFKPSTLFKFNVSHLNSQYFHVTNHHV